MSKTKDQNTEPVNQKAQKDPANSKILLLFFSFGFLLYANTISFKYALDDKIVITNNEFTKKGFGGIKDHLTHDMFSGLFGEKNKLVEGGRYRPLSLITFSIERGLFGENPNISHLVNALLYGLTAMLLYLVLLNLFPPDKNQKWFLTLPFIITALYTAHPLHTEVVANIKGRDELMSFLGALSGLYFALRYLDEKKVMLLLWSGITFFLGIFSKESAITFIGVSVITLIFFSKKSFRENVVSLLPMIAAAFVFLIIRSMVLGNLAQGQIPPELMNNPFLKAEAGQKFPTILYTMFLYLKLLVFPIQLTHDYYPWHPLAEHTYKWGSPFPYLTMSSSKAIAGLVIYLALLIYGIAGLTKAIQKKKKNIVAFGILVYLGTFILFSNLFINIGTFMNERFMYMPSLGFVIVLGYIFCPYTPELFGKKNLKTEMTSKIIFLAILLAYSTKTFSRNLAWEDDYSLAMTDVTTSSSSAKAMMFAGDAIIHKVKEIKDPAEKDQKLKQAVGYLNRSLELYPTFFPALNLLGDAYAELGEFNKSIVLYEQCLKIDPSYSYTLHNLLFIADTTTRLGKYDIALASLHTIINYNHEYVEAYQRMGELYGRNLNDFQKAEQYLNAALVLQPGNIETLQKLGTVNAIQGKMEKALIFFLTAYEIEPNNTLILENLVIIYTHSGDIVKANFYREKQRR